MAITVIDSTREALATQLDSIVEKRPNDGKWFGLGAQGELTLEDRPAGFFALVWEAVCRAFAYLASWFCSAPSALEGKMVDLAISIEAHLQKNLADKQKLYELCKYSPLILEIYRSADRMHAVGKITDAGHLTLHKILDDRASETNQLIRTEMEGSTYRPTSLISFSSRLEDWSSTVRFRCGLESVQSDELFGNNAHHCYTRDAGTFANYKNGYSMTASVSQNQTFYHPWFDSTIAIDAFGKMKNYETGERIPYKEARGPRLTFDNRFKRTMKVRIEFPGTTEDPMLFDVSSGSTHVATLPKTARDAAEERDRFANSPKITATWEEQAPQLVIACKAARYAYQMTKEGELSLDVEPLKQRELERPTFRLERNRGTGLTYQSDGKVKVDGPYDMDKRDWTYFSAYNATGHDMWLQFSFQTSGSPSGILTTPRQIGREFTQMGFPLDSLRPQDCIGDISQLEAIKSAPEVQGKVTFAKAFLPATEKIEPDEHKSFTTYQD